MNRFSILAVVIIALLTSCLDNGPKASVNDLVFVGTGIRDRKLMLDGSSEVSTTFSFIAKHDWAIIDYSGFTCDPSSGVKCENGETITVTATPLQSNNTIDTVRLSDLNFKMLSTRFVGISAYQLPQIRLPKGNKMVVAAKSESKATLEFVTSSNDIELKVEGDITASLTSKGSGKYTITAAAKSDNRTAVSQLIGTIGFMVDGVMQEGKIEVTQVAAIVLDRSEVILPSRGGGQNIFEVDSDFEVEISSNSEEFTYSHSGNTVTITTMRDNNGANMASLGTIEIWLKESPECKASIDIKQRAGKAPQTIIVHFIGTALQSYFKHNIEKMLEALNKNIQGESQVVVITTDSTVDATLYEFRYDANLGEAVKERVKKLPLALSYSAELFESILREAIEFAPAEKYALVIGSHGRAWVPDWQTDPLPKQLSSLGYSSIDQLWKRNENAEMTRHLGDGEKIRYDVEEVAAAIAANNIKLEYILFDACFMGNVESAYALRNVTKYIIGSPCEVMGYGFPYAKIMQYMLQNGGTSYDLDKICSEYVSHYKSEATTPSGCVAITHTAELEALAQAMKAVNAADQKDDFSLSKVQYYEGQNPHSFYDLGHMVELSCADAGVAAAFKKQLDKTVTSRYHTDRFYSAFGSDNIYWHDINYYSGTTTSAMVEHYELDWVKTEWYKATH